MPPAIVYTEATKTAQWKNQVSCKVVTKAVASLTSTNMIGGSAPSSTINPPGWGSGDCPTHHQRGHLIGNKLGGPGDEAKNLVTLTAGTNHPFMYEFEDCVYQCVSKNPGHTFTYTVECDYSPPFYAAVSGFDIRITSDHTFAQWGSGQPILPFPRSCFPDIVARGKCQISDARRAGAIPS